MRQQTFLQALVILAAAAVAAAVSNLTAAPERRLDWIRTTVAPRAVLHVAPQPAASLPAKTALPLDAPARPTPPAAKPAASPAVFAAPRTREFPPHPDKAWLEITPPETRSLFDRGVPFFDARRSSVYREGHIRGARSVSVWEAGLDGRLETIAGEGLDPSAPIVVYCSGGDCEDSHLLAERLWGIGLNNVLVYRDGFPDWERRGWPISKGEAP